MWSGVYVGLHVKYPLFFSDFNESLILSTDFRKTIKYQISLKKTIPMEAELFHADRRTGKTKLKVSFRNFANATKNEYGFSCYPC